MATLQCHSIIAEKSKKWIAEETLSLKTITRSWDQTCWNSSFHFLLSYFISSFGFGLLSFLNIQKVHDHQNIHHVFYFPLSHFIMKRAPKYERGFTLYIIIFVKIVWLLNTMRLKNNSYQDIKTFAPYHYTRNLVLTI